MHLRFLRFFDKFEDGLRNFLSKHPIIYALVGGVAIVLFWRGVWDIADTIPYLENPYVSLLVSILILLAVGLFVSFFVGDSIIISGLKSEKKMSEKEYAEIQEEGKMLETLQGAVATEAKILEDIKNEISKERKILESLQDK